MMKGPIHIHEPFRSTTEVIEGSAAVAMDKMVPLTIRRSGVPIKVLRGGKYTQEFDVYGVFGNTSPTSTVTEFEALLLISSKQFVIWSDTKMAPLLGNFGFVNFEAVAGDILTYNGTGSIQRFRYMVRDPQSCGLTTDIAYRVKLLSREDLS
jgi:hypothetical protein